MLLCLMRLFIYFYFYLYLLVHLWHSVLSLRSAKELKCMCVWQNGPQAKRMFFNFNTFALLNKQVQLYNVHNKTETFHNRMHDATACCWHHNIDDATTIFPNFPQLGKSVHLTCNNYLTIHSATSFKFNRDPLPTMANCLKYVAEIHGAILNSPICGMIGCYFAYSRNKWSTSTIQHKHNSILEIDIQRYLAKPSVMSSAFFSTTFYTPMRTVRTQWLCVSVKESWLRFWSWNSSAIFFEVFSQSMIVALTVVFNISCIISSKLFSFFCSQKRKRNRFE